MEDRRRRGIACEKLAKEMMRYLNNSEKVKVSITELQERFEVEVKMAKRFSKYFGKKNIDVLPAGPDGRRSGKA